MSEVKTTLLSPFLHFSSVRRYISQSYSCDDMSGQTEADACKLKAQVEHSSEKDTISFSSSSSSESKSKDWSISSHLETSHGGSPAINNPGSAPEDATEEVKQHNEEVTKSHDRPVN